MCILRLFICTALLLQEAFHGKLLKKRTEPSGGILTRVFRNTSPGFGIDSSMSSTKGAGLVGIADFHLGSPGAHEMKEMEKGLKDVYKFRAANNYGLRTRKEVRTFILNIIDSNAARLTKQYSEEFIQLGKPGGATNMDSAVNKLFDFYMISLVPALLKKFSGSPDKISPISSSPREHMLRGASCLKELKECLKLERPQENFKKTEFAFVQVVLKALYILHDQILISDKQVREFFMDEYITKAVGRHLVYIYGEEYPKLSKILNFKPDMEFLKMDSQTSELHWWLQMLDKPTEGFQQAS
ncbi:hypothetical protein PCASD_11139 [Puccinia coronata f. sp. avenae]|uniref:Uncharacterized protein n=2 Tax=Puccinia coronata f. sp. avenae TaxID=200324 RepID=A0A2N5UHH0_9BASI|nr:hypothetical protein PCASD_11139 [Puccinia coronata f. sp. avenae]